MARNKYVRLEFGKRFGWLCRAPLKGLSSSFENITIPTRGLALLIRRGTFTITSRDAISCHLDIDMGGRHNVSTA